MQHNETARQRVLEEYAILDAASEKTFTRLVRMAARMAEAPVAFLSFLKDDRCWVRAVAGGELGDVPAEASFGAQVVQSGEPQVVVEPEIPFAEGEAVGGTSSPRLYVGVPLVIESVQHAEDPIAIGALCVIDTEPHPPDEEALQALKSLAAMATNELALRMTRKQREMILEGITDAFFALDLEWRFTYLNDRAEELLQRSRQELIGRNVWDEFPEAVGSPFYKQYHKARQEQTTVSFEAYYEPLETWFRVKAYPLERGLAVYFDDITKRKEAQEALRERERYLSITLESIGDAVITTDAKGQVVRMNGIAEELTGWTQPEAAGRPLTSVFHIVDAQTGEPVENPVTTVLQHEQTVGLANHTALIAKDGTRYQIADSAAPIRTEEGEILGVVLVFRDVTEAYERREALRRSEHLLSMALQIAQAGAWVWDFKSDEITWSDETYRVFGLEPGSCEASYENWRARLHPDDRKSTEQAVRGTLERKEDLNIEYRIVRPDGAVRWINAQGKMYLDEAGEKERMIGFQIDVTERRETEQALRQSEERYRTLVERSHDAIYIYRGNRLLFVNQRTCELTGYSKDELLSMDVFQLVHPDDREKVRRIARQRVRGEAPSRYEARLVRSDGTVRYGDFSVQAITYQDEYAAIGSIRDVTERKRVEQTLRRREHKVQALYEAMAALTMTQTSDLVAERIQGLIVDTLRYPISAIRYQDDGKLVAVAVSPKCRKVMPERIDYDVDGESLVAKTFRSKEAVVYDDVRTADTTHERGEVRATAYVPIGSYGIISVGSTEVGGIERFDVKLIEILASNAESVLERIEREEALREARDEAEEMNRLKSAFLANMSHEIRTPLTSIIGFAEVLGEQDLDDTSELTRLIQRSGQRLLETLNSVLDLSQLEAGSMRLAPEPVDVAAAIRDTAEFFASQARDKEITLTIDTPDSPVEARLDRAALRRVLSNLLSNAVKFTERGGQIEVRLARAREHIDLEVEDTGIGIEETFLPHLFEAFKQESTGNTRSFEGSGLGLTITHQLVHLMGGDIQVETEKGQGTCFTVHLPYDTKSG